MNADLYRIEGLCHSRLYLSLFQENHKPGQSEDRGIRCHSWLTALFLSCFNKIERVCDSNGNVIYLNADSFRKWKEQQCQNLDYVDPGEPANVFIKSISVKKCETEANFLLNYRKPRNRDLGQAVHLLRTAAHISSARAQYFVGRADVNEQLQRRFASQKTTKLLKAEQKASFKLLDSELERMESELKDVQGKYSQPFDRTTQFLDRLRKISDVFQRAIDNPMSVNISSIEFDIKEWCEPDFIQRLQKENESLARLNADVEAYDKSQEIESVGISTLLGKHLITSLNSIMAAVNQKAPKAFEEALEADHDHIHQAALKLIDEANEAKDIQTAIAKLEQAEKTDPDMKDGIRIRLAPLNALLEWAKKNGVATTGEGDEALKGRVLSGLTRWEEALKKVEGNGPCQRGLRSEYQSYIDNFISFAKGPIDVADSTLELLASFFFRNEELDRIEKQLFDSEKSFITPLRNRYALQRIESSMEEHIEQ